MRVQETKVLARITRLPTIVPGGSQQKQPFGAFEQAGVCAVQVGITRLVTRHELAMAMPTANAMSEQFEWNLQAPSANRTSLKE